MPKNNIDPIATTNYIAVSRNMVKKLGCVESVVLSDLHERYRYWCSQATKFDFEEIGSQGIYLNQVNRTSSKTTHIY